MSSTNKTEIGLNLWLGGDKPKREDFCNDNLIIDKQIIDHKNDMSCHVSEEERNKWNTNVYCNIYYGNNESVREIATACPFDPSAVIIFPTGLPLTFGMRQIAKTIFIRLTDLPLVLQTVCVLEMTEKLLKFIKTLRVL